MNSIEELNPRSDQSGTAMMREYAAIVRQRKWFVLGSIALFMVLAWGYCIFAPQYYRSEALLVAEEPKLLDNVVQRPVEGNFEQRLFLIRLQITSRDFWGQIAKEFKIIPEGLDEAQENRAIEESAQVVEVEMIKKDQQGTFIGGERGVDAFTVSFMHGDPVTAMKVTERIAELFIEKNSKEREKSAEGASEFLDDELRALKLELEKKENQITQFKNAHIGELPQQTEANLRTLDRLQSELQLVSEGVKRHSDKLATVEKAIYDYRTYGRLNPVFGSRPLGPDPLFQKLQELRTKLVELKAEFYDEYPEILLTKEEMRKVEEELVALYGPDAIKPGKKPLDPYLQDLEKLQSEERTELGLAKQRLETLQASKKDLERRVDKFPEVEQELIILERDYNNMKTNYAMLLDKRLHARVKENMEKRQQGGKIRILSPASFPRVPFIPNRPKVLVFGFLLGCFFGVGLSVMRERLMPQFRGAEDVELLIGPQLLAAIPDFSFLWNPTKAPRYFSGTYLARKARGNVEESKDIALRDRLQIYGGNGHSIDRRFVTKMFPRSMAAEQYRVAAARLQLSSAGSAVAVVTSAIKGEGKTTTAINLGYTLARDFGKRVLLVDCDFVFPELKCFTERPLRHGLIDYLKGDVAMDDAMVPFAEIPCWIMPAGLSDVDPNELLKKTDQLERVFTEMRARFDYILLNAPPILPVAAMNVLEKYVDSLLLVVRANLTSQQVVKRALSSLRVSKPLHVILNGVASQSLPYYMTDYALLESQQRV